MKNNLQDNLSATPASPYVAYLQDSVKPITCLLFVLPMLIIYHLGIWAKELLDSHSANGADILLAKILNLAYYSTLWLYANIFPNSDLSDSYALWFLKSFGSLFSLFFLVFVLLFQQHIKNCSWKIKVSTFFYMTLESIVFALPPFLLAWGVDNVFFRIEAAGAPSWLDGVILSFGAGVYEEFFFRMLLMGLFFWLYKHVFKLSGSWLYCLAVLSQALIFSGFHYLPWTGEAFKLPVFAFRTIAGVYFAYIYHERGFGIVAGAHAFYDIIAESINDF